MWFDESGEPMHLDVWHDPHRRVLVKYSVSPALDDRNLLVVVNGAGNDVDVTIPALDQRFELVWDSAWERPADTEPVVVDGGDTTTVAAMSMRVYLSL